MENVEGGRGEKSKVRLASIHSQITCKLELGKDAIEKKWDYLIGIP